MNQKRLPFLISSILILGLTYSCTIDNQKHLKIKAQPINGSVKGNILSGPSVYNDPDRFVWGASVIKGKDGKFHMLYGTWDCGDSIPQFSNAWVLYSKIAYAVSEYPDRDFKFKKIVLRGRVYSGDSTAWDAQMVSNPHIKEFNGKHYLYYIGSVDPGIQPVGSKGENVDKRNRVQQNQKIGVIEFESFADLLNGKFERPDAPLLFPRTRVKADNIVNPSPEGTLAKPDNIIVVNPSVVQRPSDGKFLLYFKGNFYDPHWRGVHGVAIGDSPKGPFQATDNLVFDIRNSDGTIAMGEDPYVWYHRDHQKFYVVLKDFSGKITQGKPGLALMESENGINWVKAANSFFMKKELILKSGDTLQVDRLERPQLLISNNDEPQVLYAACSIEPANNKKDGSTFNVHILLETE
ncbi:MAG: glycoside hydrolase family protein [Bacteroidota bacterium]